MEENCCAKSKKFSKKIQELGYLENEKEKNIQTLEKQISFLEDSMECSICFDNSKNCALFCGHQFCYSCCSRINCCPFCRKPINDGKFW